MNSFLERMKTLHICTLQYKYMYKQAAARREAIEMLMFINERKKKAMHLFFCRISVILSSGIFALVVGAPMLLWGERGPPP